MWSKVTKPVGRVDKSRISFFLSLPQKRKSFSDMGGDVTLEWDTVGTTSPEYPHQGIFRLRWKPVSPPSDHWQKLSIGSWHDISEFLTMDRFDPCWSYTIVQEYDRTLYLQRQLGEDGSYDRVVLKDRDTECQHTYFRLSMPFGWQQFIEVLHDIERVMMEAREEIRK